LSCMSYVDKKSNKKKEAIRQEVKQKEERIAYKAASHLQETTRQICKTWCNGSCHANDDLLKFMRLYAQRRAFIKFNVFPPTIISWTGIKAPPTQVQLNETATLHKYGKDLIQFFNQKDYTSNSRFPSCGEYKEFLTFQWMLYTANNVSAEKNPSAKYAG
jgi:hypothetical protein